MRNRGLIAGETLRKASYGVSSVYHFLSALSLTFLYVYQGGLMTVVLTAQFSAFSNFMHPGKRPIRDLIALPLVYGVAVGFAFGAFNVMSKP